MANGLTVMLIALEVVTAPALSVALAVSVKFPAATLFHVKLYGDVVSVPNSVLPLNNSTLLMVPSLSVAVASMAIFAGAVKVAPLAGLVMLTVGDRLADGLTVMLIGLEVVAAPELSVALAVSV